MNRTALTTVLATVLTLAASVRGQSAAPFYHVSRLSYDDHCMTVDGHDLFLFSGAFHYFRCPKPLWADRFRTLRNAGFNCLETYAAWDYHERTPPAGPDDMSKLDMTDLHDWLEMATQQFGFYVVLRPGPYICAEWDGGGYPQWLLPLRPEAFKGRMWLRSDDPAYLAWCRHWYAAVAKVAVPYQVTHRPAGQAGVVLWQVENEYDFIGQPIGVKVNQVRFLAHTARDLGVDVPLLTCETNDRAFHRDPYLRANVVQTCNSYAGFNMSGLINGIRGVAEQQPEKFHMVTELQGGWFAQVGGKLSDQQGYNAAQLNQITLVAYERGCTVTNYYMGFGGTNLADWAAQGLIASYDYDAPVREAGGTTARYQAARAIGQFVADHGTALARSTSVDAEVRVTDPAVHVAVRRAADGDYVFVRTETRHQDHRGPLGVTIKGDRPRTIEADYELGDFGAKVLFAPAHGEQVWYPKPQPEPQRPATLPAAVTITDGRRTVDPGPTLWRPFDPARTAAQVGILDRYPVFYRAEVPTAAAALGADQRLGLSFDLPGKDEAVVAVEGQRVAADALGLYPVAGRTHEGGLTATILYDNAGRPNFGDGLEQPSGLLHGRVRAFTTAEPATAVGGWREHHLARGERPAKFVAATVDDAGWAAADVSADAGDLQPQESAVYRATVTLTDAQAAAGGGRRLTLGSVDDEGQVYVNGRLAGEGHDWATPVQVDTGNLLHAGSNVVAVVVHNRDGGGGLCKGVTLAPAGRPMPVTWTFSQDGQGSLNHWYEQALDDTGWTPIHLTDASPPADPPGTLLTWTRLPFHLPTPTPSVWVPWRATIDCGGDGFVYLNGHCLGRWWQAGPQHDFYLPECWLNFGPGGPPNVLTVALHPTDQPAVVHSAVVQPYGEQAEVR